MSIMSMIDAKINRERQVELYVNAERRAEVREACKRVLNAQTTTEEYNEIVALQKLLPNT